MLCVLGSAVWLVWETWWRGWGSLMEQQHRPSLSALMTAWCQGRSSPDPSGVGPVPGHSCCCQERGHWFVEEEVVLEGGRVRGLARAAQLVPGHPVPLHHSCPRQGELTCCPYLWAVVPAFLAREAQDCWCTAHPVPGAGRAPAMYHKPAFPWAWAGTWGKSWRGCELLRWCSMSSILPGMGGLSST